MGEPYSKSGVLFVTFNQDCTCVAIGSQQGLHVYNVDTHKLCYRHAIGAVSIVEMLFCTSLLGFVGAGEQPALTPRKLTVLNTTASRTIQELTYPTSVLAVRMNRHRLVVVTARHVHIYSMQNLACLRVIDTEESQQGCCALTGCHEPNLLALPSSSTTGTVRIYDLGRDGGNVLSEVQAHQTPVTCLAWSCDGSLLATASAKGTLIRVHRLPAASRVTAFRRGATSASIQSLAFGPPSLPAQLLLAASSHGTVHVFRLEDAEPPQGGAGRPASGAVGLLSAVMRYSVGDLVEPARNIATIRLPHTAGAVTCAFRQGPHPLPLPTVKPPGTAAAAAATATARASSTGAAPAAAEPVAAAAGGGAGFDDSSSSAAAAAAAWGGSAAAPPAGAGAGAGAAAGSTEGDAGILGFGGEGGGGGGEGPRAVIMVATLEGLLYEYGLSDLLNPQGPKCNLEGEWSMLGSGSVLG